MARMHLYVIFGNRIIFTRNKTHEKCQIQYAFGCPAHFFAHFVDGITYHFSLRSAKKSFEPNQNCCNKLLGEQTVHPHTDIACIAECRRIAITWSPEVFHVEKNKSNLVFIPVEKRRMPFLCNLFAPFICCGSNHSHQIILKISIASFFSLSAMNSTFFTGCNSNIS